MYSRNFSFKSFKRFVFTENKKVMTTLQKAHIVWSPLHTSDDESASDYLLPLISCKNCTTSQLYFNLNSDVICERELSEYTA